MRSIDSTISLSHRRIVPCVAPRRYGAGMKIRFWPAVLILIVVAVTLRLGFWQRDRAHQKEALNARITAFENAPAQRIGVSRCR